MILRVLPPSVVFLAVLSACSPDDGGDDGGGGGGAAAAPSTASRVTALTSVDECANGGVQVETGIDENENGLLDDDEVDDVVIVCNGTDGTPGTNGTPGTDGTNAITRVDDEAAGANCAAGGVAVHAGVDEDGDGALDEDEIDSTRYVCDGSDGTNGTDGTDGTNGTDGTDGTNGTNGTNGRTSLIRVDDEPPGTNCLEGGVAVNAGLDDDGDGVLDDDEVDSTRYVCDGPSADNVPCGVLEGSVVVRNALDVRALRGCTEITGELLVEGDIRSLVGLEALTSVGALDINQTFALETLDGLENLRTIRGGLDLNNNEVLVDISALDGVVRVGRQVFAAYNCVLPVAALLALAARVGVACDCPGEQACLNDDPPPSGPRDDDGNGRNDPVDAVDDVILAERDVELTIPLSVLLANDVDPDGDAVIAAVFAPTNLRAQLRGSAISVVPAPAFSGTASFRYTLVNTGGAIDTALVTVDVAAARCGSGVEVGAEECDDGNTAANDGCGPTCRIESCGDGVVQANENCDDGRNGDDTDGCDDRCDADRCGDGDLDGVEECDDGNNVDGDACSGACVTEFCGDGVVNGEAPVAVSVTFDWAMSVCDVFGANPPNIVFSVDGTDARFALPLGDNNCNCESVGQRAETADPEFLAAIRRSVRPAIAAGLSFTEDSPGFVELAWITATVQYASGQSSRATLVDFSGSDAAARQLTDICDINRGYFNSDVAFAPTTLAAPVAVRDECEDGNAVDGDGCDTNCRRTACGNGVQTAGEQCDDGNRVDGDGCTAACVVEPCGDGVINTREQCDDGNVADDDGCDSNCRLTACGNGVVTTGEQCDDGNTASNDGCDALCFAEVCGDGIVQRGLGERCDDGNNVDGDGCSADCASSEGEPQDPIALFEKFGLDVVPRNMGVEFCWAIARDDVDCDFAFVSGAGESCAVAIGSSASRSGCAPCAIADSGEGVLTCAEGSSQVSRRAIPVAVGEISSFTVEPAAVTAGEPVRLCWEITNNVSCSVGIISEDEAGISEELCRRDVPFDAGFVDCLDCVSPGTGYAYAYCLGSNADLELSQIVEF